MKGIRLYGDQKTGLLVSEPQVRIIKVPVYDIKDRYNEGRMHFRPYTLAFPYLYMWGPGSFVGMSKLPPEELLASEDRLVYPLPLPNSYENCGICGISGETILKYAEKFWNSNFCQETAGYYGGKRLPYSTMKNLRTWEKLTAIDPTFILKENCNFGTEPIELPWVPEEQRAQKQEEMRIKAELRRAEAAERRRQEREALLLKQAQEKLEKEANAAKIKEKMQLAMKKKGLA